MTVNKKIHTNTIRRAAEHELAMTAIEHQMTFSERVIELPEFLTCDYHGEYSSRGYYDDSEIVDMIDEQGFIFCPLCLAGIVGIE